MKKSKKRAAAFLVALAALNPGINSIIYETNNAIVAEAAVQSSIKITEQPQSIIGTMGETKFTTVNAVGDNLTYQWYFREKGKTSWTASGYDTAKTNSLAVKISATTLNRVFKCVISDSNGYKLETREISVVDSSTNGFEIIDEPEDIVGEIGETKRATVNATGEGLTYQWYFRDKSKTSWNVSGYDTAKTNSLSVKISATTLNRVFKCVVTDANGDVLETREVDVAEETASKFEIIGEPEDIVGEIGETKLATVNATGEGLTYQWYFRDKSKTSWTVSGYDTAKTNSLSVKISATTLNRVFKCVVTDANGYKLETREVAVVDTSANKFEIIDEPEDIVGEIGETKLATVNATGEGLTYQWYFRDKSKTSWTASGYDTAKTNSLSVKISTTTLNRVFKCVVKDANGNTLETREVNVAEAVKYKFEITGEPADIVGKVGETKLATVNAVGDNLTYQWYFRDKSKTNWNISGYDTAKTNSLSVKISATTLNRVFKCVVTDANGNTLETREVNVAEIKEINIVSPSSAEIKLDETATFSVTAEGKDLTYKWETSADGTNWSAYTGEGANTASISVVGTKANNGTQYRCVVTDAYGQTATSEPATLTVKANECGENVTWNFENGILTISGTGNMTNYAQGTSPFDELSGISEIIVEEGVTSIGTNAFSNCGAENITVLNNMCVIRGGSATIPANATLNGYSKSEAADYAKNNNIVFNAIDSDVEFTGNGVLSVGETFQIESNGKNMRYISVSNEIATVDNTGLVTAVNIGNAYIIAYDDKGHSQTYLIQVLPEAAKPKFQYNTLTIPVGKYVSIDRNSSCGLLGNDESIVSIEDEWYSYVTIKGLKEGNTDIVGLSNSLSDTLFVNVKNEIEPISTDVKFYGDTYYPHNTFYELTAEKTGTYIIQANAESDNFGMSLLGSADLSEDPYWSEYGSSPEIRTELKAGDTVYFYFSDSQNEEKSAYGTNFTASVKCNEYIEQDVVSGEGIRNVHTDSENTWYKLTGKANTDYLIEANNLTSYQNLYVEFFNEDKTDTIRDNMDGSNVFERFSVSEDETVYIRVNAESGSTFEYDLKITELPRVEKDVVSETAYTGSADDYDNTWYKITAEEAAKYLINGRNTSNGKYMNCIVYDANKENVIADAYYSTGFDVEFKLNAGETAYVRFVNSYRGEKMNYEFTVKESSANVVEVESAVRYSGTTSRDNVIWYKLTAEEDMTYMVDAASNSYINLIAYFDDQEEELDSRYCETYAYFSIDLKKGQTVYIVVESNESSENADYELTVIETPYKVFYPSMNTVYEGTASDYDNTWYAVTSAMDENYILSVENISSSYLSFGIYDENHEYIDGAELSGEGQTSFKFALGADSVVYVRFDSSYHNEYAGYSFMLTYEVDDDNIKALVLNEWTAGHYEYSENSDIFKFTAPEDGIYFFTSKSEEDTCGHLYDDKELLNQIAYNDDDGDGNQFKIEYKLEAGQTVYLKPRNYTDTSPCDYEVIVYKFELPEGVIGVLDSGYGNYVYGNFTTDSNYAIIQVNVSYPDNPVNIVLDASTCVNAWISFSPNFYSEGTDKISDSSYITWDRTYYGSTFYIVLESFNGDEIGDFTCCYEYDSSSDGYCTECGGTEYGHYPGCSNAGIDECYECGGMYGSHAEWCSSYYGGDDMFNCPDCGASAYAAPWEHSMDCPCYVEP